MVNLSLDPPPFGRSSGGGRGSGGLGRLLFYVFLLLLGLAGGFMLGRKTTPSSLPFGIGGTAGPGAAPAQAPAPATGNANPARGAAPVQQPASGPQGAAASQPGAGLGAATATTVVPNAASAPPGAPQGPLLRHLSVTLRGSLEESVTAALPPGERSWAQQLTAVSNRILVWSMQVARDGRKGDKLDVLYELPSVQPSEVTRVSDAGPSVKEPIVLALRYGSQKLGRLITAYRYKPEGAPFARYYTSGGVEVEEHLVDSPVDQYEQVTSLLRDGRRHKGVDFKTPVGTPVKAPFDGQIARRNWHFSANGNCIEVIDAKTGRHAIFLHLESVPKEMQPGRKVRKGEVLASSGNSGHSTAPHLHYQLESPDGHVLDPYAVQPTVKVTLEGPARAGFDAERSRLDPLLVAER